MDKIQASGVYMEQQEDENLLLIEAYGGGGFRLQERRVEGSVLVLAQGYFPVAKTVVKDLAVTDFDKLFAADEKTELLLVGTGDSMTLLPKEIRLYLEQQGLPYELMDTGAAARTYNVLLMEGRRVSALLLAVD
ncbi:Mth938-like domain-containing protein [Kordiimonas pumila]|uniref:Mth938-like domain-containing protein n=1 Tax=Kordiimonas pumila TaxID=2161677 RepID=A0ABV7D328_9PROT|nr:MTH938/NDUFAF3 family protein [Kordiimonas pumila]